MFRFITAHLAGLPFPSRKRQTRQVETRLNYTIESEHIYDKHYFTCQKKENGAMNTPIEKTQTDILRNSEKGRNREEAKRHV
jgi:hypothetical protein